MKSIIGLVLLTTMVGVATWSVFAQGRGWARGQDADGTYNPRTVEAITGEVGSVEKIQPTKGMSYGVHLMLKTDQETISIHLGPAWFIDNQDVKIAPHDRIEVRGSRVTFRGKPAIIAARVTKGDQVLTLRDAEGFPVWSGWRSR